MNNQHPSAILLTHCPDRPGLVASITKFIFDNGGNIIDLDQYVETEQKMFFMRVKWDLENFKLAPTKIGESFHQTIAQKLGMQWKLFFSDETPRIAIYVSKLSHCLYDILSRWHSGEWQIEIPLILGNHPDLEAVAKQFGIAFHLFPITPGNKQSQEKQQIELLRKHRIDLVVLARYMQVLSEEFINLYPNQIINIHHSFLPAFAGPRSYQLAHERGVKIIGATSHYVTTDLDAGPIIEQDVARVSHKDSVEDLIRLGRDLEKVVLSRAIWYHLQRKILVYQNRTLVF